MQLRAMSIFAGSSMLGLPIETQAQDLESKQQSVLLQSRPKCS